MSRARIHKLTRNVMQAGTSGTRLGVLEYEPESPLFRDPLTGWTGSADTMRQVRLTFQWLAAAMRYADRRGLRCVVTIPQGQEQARRSSADNFAPDRAVPFTH